MLATSRLQGQPADWYGYIWCQGALAEWGLETRRVASLLHVTPALTAAVLFSEDGAIPDNVDKDEPKS